MKKMIRPALLTAFGIYCFILIYIVFLSRGAMIHYSYAQYFRQFTNFIPFKTIIEYVQRYHNGFRNLSVLNLLGNFVLFMPMGALLPYIIRKLNRFWKVTLTVLGMVVVVEIVQGILRVGSVDIDDVLFNVVGAMIGYGLIRLPFIYNFFKKINLIKGKDSVPDNINVKVESNSIFGDFSNRTTDREDVPTLCVSGKCLFGKVEIDRQ